MQSRKIQCYKRKPALRCIISWSNYGEDLENLFKQRSFRLVTVFLFRMIFSFAWKGWGSYRKERASCSMSDISGFPSRSLPVHYTVWPVRTHFCRTDGTVCIPWSSARRNSRPGSFPRSALRFSRWTWSACTILGLWLLRIGDRPEKYRYGYFTRTRVRVRVKLRVVSTVRSVREQNECRYSTVHLRALS